MSADAIVAFTLAIVMVAGIYIMLGMTVGFWLDYKDDYPALCIIGWPLLIIIELIKNIIIFIKKEFRR